MRRPAAGPRGAEQHRGGQLDGYEPDHHHPGDRWEHVCSARRRGGGKSAITEPCLYRGAAGVGAVRVFGASVADKKA